MNDKQEAKFQELTGRPVGHLVCKMAVPTIISMMVTSIYNMADTYFVSQINTSASGAVGIVFSIMAIIQAVGFTIGMGSGSVASRLLGQGLPDRAAVIASSAVVAAVVCGSLLTLAGLGTLEHFVWILGATETIYPYALQYATYILWGAPVMCLAFTLNNLLRWQGKANRTPAQVEYDRTYNRLKQRKNRKKISIDEWNIAVAKAQELMEQAGRGELTDTELKRQLELL